MDRDMWEVQDTRLHRDASRDVGTGLATVTLAARG